MYFHCVSIHIDGRAIEICSTVARTTLTIAHVCGAHARRLSGRCTRGKSHPAYARESLTFTSQPVSSRDISKETWSTGSQAAADLPRDRPRRKFATRGSTLPVILDVSVRTARLPDFSRLFARNLLLDNEDPDYPSRQVDGSRYDTGCN